MRCRRAVLPLSAAWPGFAPQRRSVLRRKSNIETAAARCGRYGKDDPSGRDSRPGMLAGHDLGAAGPLVGTGTTAGVRPTVGWDPPVPECRRGMRLFAANAHFRAP